MLFLPLIAEMEVSGAGATTTVPQGLAHLPFDAHLSNSFSIDALLLASSHVPMADSTTNSQSWDVDPFSTDEHWLPLDMDMTNRDLPRDQITEDSDWGMPYKVAGELSVITLFPCSHVLNVIVSVTSSPTSRLGSHSSTGQHSTGDSCEMLASSLP
jgi:hypothetical protein